MEALGFALIAKPMPCGASMQKLITPVEGIKFSPVPVCLLYN